MNGFPAGSDLLYDSFISGFFRDVFIAVKLVSVLAILDYIAT